MFTNYQSVDYKAALVDNEAIGSEQDYNLLSQPMLNKKIHVKIDIDELNKGNPLRPLLRLITLRAETYKIVEELAMANDVILYRTDDGESAIELHLDNGTV